MSVSCKAVLGPFIHPAVCPTGEGTVDICNCPLVDFDVTITGLCNKTRYGIVAVVKCDNRIVATVCDIFDVDVPNADKCACVNVTRHFKNVMVDVEACTDVACTFSVDIACGNYILGCCTI
ncbi:hypothetical protein [Clostridium sp. JS66]|uniref:hypothetical protein n=1 Tax=Clostridium sp. JS66 TaxID=3064705 RepID=UPI00298E28E5|nr:hypothetical protein [Clostridium sp. JS66]WPC41344.1 hypothetical protein Q6H37_26165 [Clostridium sp. JS66]